MLVPHWPQGCWVRRTPSWERQTDSPEPMLPPPLPHSAGIQLRAQLSPTLQRRGGIPGKIFIALLQTAPHLLLPLPILWRVFSALWEMKTTPDGGDGQPGQSPAPYTRTRCAKPPSFGTSQGRLPTCLELRGAEGAAQGWYEAVMPSYFCSPPGQARG